MKKLFTISILVLAAWGAEAAKLKVLKNPGSEGLRALKRTFVGLDNGVEAESTYLGWHAGRILSRKPTEKPEKTLKQFIYMVRASLGSYSIPEDIELSPVLSTGIQSTAKTLATQALSAWESVKDKHTKQLTDSIAEYLTKNPNSSVWTGGDGNSFGSCSWAAIESGDQILLLESCYSE